jgi:DNA repair exonuclease SbcCD ATPase subunit
MDFFTKLGVGDIIFNADQREMIQFNNASLEDRKVRVEQLKSELKAKKNEREFIRYIIKKNLDELSAKRSELLKQYKEQSDKIEAFRNYPEEKMQRDLNLVKELVDQMGKDQRKYEEDRVKIEREISELDDRVNKLNFNQIDGIDNFVKEKEDLYAKLLAIREDFESKYTTTIRRTQESIDKDIGNLENELKSKTEALSEKTKAFGTLNLSVMNEAKEKDAEKVRADSAQASVYRFLHNFSDPQSFQASVY